MKNININLLPWREQMQQQSKIRFYLCFSVTVLLAVILVLITHWMLVYKIDRQQQRNVLLQQAIDTYQSRFAAIAQLSQLQDEWRTKASWLTELHDARVEVLQLFNELLTFLPEQAYWQRIDRQDRQLTLVGLSYDEQALTQLTQEIAGSTWLAELQLSRVALDQQDDENEDNWQQFTLTVVMCHHEFECNYF